MLEYVASNHLPIKVLIHMLGIIRIDYRQGARPRRNADACGHLAGLILLCYITFGRDRSPVSKLSSSLSLCMKR